MQKVQLLDKTFDIQMSEKKRKSSLRWAALNLLFLSVIYYDVASKFPRENEVFYIIEVIACVILSLSFITNVLTFIFNSFFVDKVVCETETQKILLNLSNNSSILRSPQPKNQAPVGNPNETINIRNLSYQNYSERKLNPRKQVKVSLISSLQQILRCYCTTAG